MLCPGPLSTNIIDVSLDCAKQYDIPMILVASRRQIECREFGGGYVNNWSTEDYVQYVSSKKVSNVILGRDHGGPWQGNYEVAKNLDVSQSMAAAKKSYEVDIDAGIQIIHIDPTIAIQDEELNAVKITERLFELYGHVVEYAASKNKKIAIEVGTEEQNGHNTSLEELQSFLAETHRFCQKNKFDSPLYVVVQTGAKVTEDRNVGDFETSQKSIKEKLITNIRSAASLALKYNVLIKEHNADYLSVDNLRIRPQIGIRASNVAPEFGLVETGALLELLLRYGPKADYESFINIVTASGKWKKWTQNEAALDDRQKARLAGHYCFSDPRVVEIKMRLKGQMARRGEDLDEALKSSIRKCFDKYIQAYGLQT